MEGVSIRTKINTENCNSLLFNYPLALQITHPFLNGCRLEGWVLRCCKSNMTRLTLSNVTNLTGSWGSGLCVYNAEDRHTFMVFGNGVVIAPSCKGKKKIQMFKFLGFKRNKAGALMMFVCLTPPWHKGGCFHGIKGGGKSWDVKFSLWVDSHRLWAVPPSAFTCNFY